MNTIRIICIIIVIVFAITILSTIIIEHSHSTKASSEELAKYKEIFELEEQGSCDTCEYGLDNCMNDGQAHCKKGDN